MRKMELNKSINCLQMFNFPEVITMSNVIGCQIGNGTKINKCNDCERAPYSSEKCKELICIKVGENCYVSKPFLALMLDGPIVN